MINNRQNGRRRGRGGPQVRNGSGNGPERGNRIDNRARGNAAQLHEKYRNLARDAQTQGDRVMTEYYLQFADHYFRVLSEGRARFEEQGANQAQQRRQHQSDDFDEGYEGEPGDESSEAEMAPRRFDREPRREAAYDDGEQSARQNGDGNGYDRDNRDRDNRDREGRQPRGNRDGQYGRDNQYNRGEGRNDGRGEGRGEGRNGQYQRPDRDNRPAAAERDEQSRQTYQPREAAPAEAVTPPAVEAGAEAPRPRRGRPPRNAAPVAAEPAESGKAQIEVDRLPPAFALEVPEAAPAPAPRTRRKSAATAAPAAEPEIRAVEGEPSEPAPRRRRVRRETADDSNVAA